jgi:hypothetical protein
MGQNSIEVSRCNLHLPTTHSDMVPGYRSPEPGWSSSSSLSRQYRSSLPDHMGRIQRHIWLVNQADYTPNRIIYIKSLHGSFASFPNEMRPPPCLDLTIQHCKICSRHHTNVRFHFCTLGSFVQQPPQTPSRNAIFDIHHTTHQSQSFRMSSCFAM